MKAEMTVEMKTAGPWTSLPHGWRLSAVALSLALVYGCAALAPALAPHPHLYSLDGAREAAPQKGTAAAATAPTLIVSPPHAAAGFDSRRIMYVRQAGELEYFAHNEWIDTPARMLAPLIVAAVESGGTFRAVVQTPSAVAGDMRLDTEVLRLQQDFGSSPSRVRFTLRAYMMDSKTRRVLAQREFDETAVAASEDPYGGVVAANSVVQIVLRQLAAFCTEAARNAQMEK